MSTATGVSLQCNVVQFRCNGTGMYLDETIDSMKKIKEILRLQCVGRFIATHQIRRDAIAHVVLNSNQERSTKTRPPCGDMLKFTNYGEYSIVPTPARRGRHLS